MVFAHLGTAPLQASEAHNGSVPSGFRGGGQRKAQRIPGTRRYSLLLSNSRSTSSRSLRSSGQGVVFCRVFRDSETSTRQTHLRIARAASPTVFLFTSSPVKLPTFMASCQPTGTLQSTVSLAASSSSVKVFAYSPPAV